MDESQKQAFINLETLIKYNYTNLETKIDKLEGRFDELQKQRTADHDSLTNLKKDVEHNNGDYDSHLKDEKDYGKALSNKIDDLKNSIELHIRSEEETLKNQNERIEKAIMSRGQILGIITGSIVVLGVLFKLADYALKILKIGG